MWKIFFKYNDGSKCTITGKKKEISLDEAIKYHNDYGVHAVQATYQQYPKKDNDAIDLHEKIEQLQEELEDEKRI